MSNENGNGIKVDIDALSKISPRAAASLVAALPIEENDLAMLNAVHSETTLNERRFIYNFMRSVWSGQDAVLEIGTYLGGTTRCLGLGMAANPNAGSPKLVSCDRFAGYHRPQRLLSDTEPLWRDLPDNAAVTEELSQGRWRALFERLHKPTAYGPFLQIVETSLPDRSGENDPQQIADAVKSVRDLSVVFVDGCKSWYATKSFMRTVIDATISGGWVMVQDYHRYTCFWLPMFFDAFRDVFEPRFAVSGTYTFAYKGGLSSDAISKRFPDAPTALSEAEINACFHRLYKHALIVSDTNSLLVLHVQHAGALAYVGNTDKAREIIENASTLPGAAAYESMFKEALVTPTFSPDTPIYLPKKSAASEPVISSKKVCNICGCEHFLPGFNGRLTNGAPPMCSQCKTVERHRTIRDIYARARPLLKDWQALQFAPDRSVDPAWFKSYRSAIYGSESSLDMMETGLPDASFDLVMSNHVLEHVSDDVKALQELLRIVGDKGLVHFMVPSPTFFWATDDWKFADRAKNEHYRDYGADFAMELARKVGDCHAISIASQDPVTGMPDLVYLFSRSNERLAQFVSALGRGSFAITRVT